MKNQKMMSSDARNYKKIGVIAAAVIAVAALGMWGVKHFANAPVSVDAAIKNISADAFSGADMRMAIVRMDAIQAEAKVLADLRKQRESYEGKLRDELTRRQKELEKEKTEIEKSQDVLSREALQKRVSDYQQKVARLQQDLSTRAQAIDVSFQKALAKIQSEHMDPIVDAVIAKKNLTLVIDGRFARVSNQAAQGLDITQDIVSALDKRISSAKMEKPTGF
jgi:Skp family chaperone for outer membrane proteins